MPKNPRANETILNPATTKGTSLRTTVPAFIIGQFELKKGDILRWSIEGKNLKVKIVKNVGGHE